MGRKSRISENSQLSPSSSFRAKLRRKNEVDTNRSTTTSPQSTLTLKGSINLDYSKNTNKKSLNKNHEGSTTTKCYSKIQVLKSVLKIHLLEQPRTLRCLIGVPILLRVMGGVLLAVGYFLIISRHFQSLTNFSSLSNLEKELSLPTQTAFRYSFFKKVAMQQSFLKGIRALIYDNSTNWPTTTNSFQKYALTPEVVLGGAFHVVKNTEQLFDMSLDNCWKGSGTGGWEHWRCSGLTDPMTFYLNVNWLLDSCFVAFLYISGYILSNSIVGGLLTSLTFVLNHPQISDWEKMFPDDDKVGSYFAYGQISLLPYLLFTKSHPSWTPVVKMGLMVGALILTWPMESQWILSSQLLIALLLHFTNFLSPFLISIVIAAHLTGWEYATLMTFDTSFINWSFYGYLFLASLGVVFILRPIVDRLLADKLDKWMFLRAIILLLGFHILLTAIRRDLRPLFSTINEDPRMSIYMDGYPGPDTLNKTSSSTINLSGGVVAVTVEERAFSESENTLSRWLSAIENDDSFSRSGSSSEDKDGETGLLLESLKLSSKIPSGFLNTLQQQQQSESSEEERTIYDLKDSKSLQIKEDDEETTGIGEEVSRILSSSSSSRSSQEQQHSYFTTTQENVMEIVSGRNKMKSVPFDNKLYKLNRFLHHCLLSAVKYPIRQFIYQNSFLLSLFLFTALSHLLFSIRRWKEKEATVRISGQVGCYHFLHTFSLLCLTCGIHNKFQICALAQLSLCVSLLVDYRKFWWFYERFNLSVGKRAHSLILVALLSVMISSAKLRLDRLYSLPQTQERVEGDSEGIGELLEATNWIRKNSESNKAFLGPAPLMVNVYLSGERPCMNHLEDTLPYWRVADDGISDHLSHLYGLFSKEKSVVEFHKELLISNATYLFLSQKFCSYATFPFTSETVKEEKVLLPILSMNGNEDNPLEDNNHIRISNNRRRNGRNNNGFLSTTWQQYTPAPTLNKKCCDMRTFWEEENNQIDISEADGNKSGMEDTLCHRLINSSPSNIKPFRRPFSNRMFTILETSPLV